MMRTRLTAAGLAGALAAFLIVGVAFAAVTNGSFESSLTGWTEEAGRPVEVVCGWDAADSNCLIDMAASPSSGKISQVLPTTVGTTYTVNFALAGNPTCTPSSPSWVTWITEDAVKYLRVTATGSVGLVGGQEFTFDTSTTSVSAMGWVNRSIIFTADSATTVLAFEVPRPPGNCGPAIDNVSISGDPLAAVPTSADQCKKGGWQTLTDHLGNKFKNQGDCVSYVATAGKNLGAIALQSAPYRTHMKAAPRGGLHDPVERQRSLTSPR